LLFLLILLFFILVFKKIEQNSVKTRYNTVKSLQSRIKLDANELWWNFIFLNRKTFELKQLWRFESDFFLSFSFLVKFEKKSIHLKKKNSNGKRGRSEKNCAAKVVSLIHLLIYWIIFVCFGRYRRRVSLSPAAPERDVTTSEPNVFFCVFFAIFHPKKKKKLLTEFCFVNQYKPKKHVCCCSCAGWPNRRRRRATPTTKTRNTTRRWPVIREPSVSRRFLLLLLFLLLRFHLAQSKIQTKSKEKRPRETPPAPAASANEKKTEIRTETAGKPSKTR